MGMAIRPFLFALLVSLPIGSGCGALTDWVCGDEEFEDDCGGLHEVAGSQDEFSAGPRVEDAVVVSAPARCGELGDEPVHAVRVQVEGSAPDSTRAWLEERALEQLREPGRPTPSFGVAGCEDANWTGDAAVFVNDWGQVDGVVDTLVDLALEDGIGIDIVVFVEPMVIPCAQYESCGY